MTRFGARITPNSGGKRIVVRQTIYNEKNQTYVIDSRDGVREETCDVNDDKAIGEAIRAALRGELAEEA